MSLHDLENETTPLPKRRRWRLWGLALLLLLGGVGYYVYVTYVQPPAQTDAPVAQPTPTPVAVRRDDLVVIVNGVGTLVAANELSLAFDATGRVREVLVKPGDVVSATQVLARLDDTAARREIFQMEIAVRQAELQLTRLTQPATAGEIAAAQADLAAAQAAQQALTTAPASDAVAAVQNELISAEQALADLLDGASADQLTTLSADLRSSEIAQQAAQYNYDRVAWQLDSGMTSEAAALKNATIAYEKATANYRLATADPSAAEVAAAGARVAAVRADLTALQAEPDEFTLNEHASRVAEAEARLATLLHGSDDATALEAATLAVQQAQQNLDVAQLDLNSTEIQAPVAGIVTAVNVQVGEQTGNAAVVTLAELASSQVQFWVEEADAPNIAIGNRVSILFEAYPSHPFDGAIVRIDPTLVTVDGAAALQVWASIDRTQHPVNLLYNMNAEVEVIAGEAQDALLVPIETLRELVPGAFAVFVVQANGELELRPVEVGVKDLIYAEIRSGLTEGELVTTAAPTE